MRKCTLIFSIVCIYAMTYAQYSKKVELKFDPKEYEIEYNSFDEGMIVSYNTSTFFESDTNRPCIPYMMVSVAVPIDKEYESHTVSSDGKCLFAEDITLANNPIIVPTSYTGTIEEKPASYKKCKYPETTASNEVSSTVGKYRILNFKVSPFEYDAESGMLKFSKKIPLNIKLKDIYVDPDKISFVRNDSYMTLRNVVVNKTDIEPVEDNDNETSTNPGVPQRWDQYKLQYIIVTSESLEQSFYPLMEWKNQKGVKAGIVTVKYIDEHCNGETLALKIKNYLYNLYVNQSLQFVLLGGDSDSVPTFECNVACLEGHKATNTMPTDMFYACFGGAFDWDGNGNGKCGELDDNIELFPNIAVTRFPARDQEDVDAFVSKTLYYEKTPMQNGWNNEILMSGNKLWGYISPYPNYKSDAEAKGKKLYESICNI